MMKTSKQDKRSEYAQAGVDYKKIEPFKMAMIKVGKLTLRFPQKRGIRIVSDVLHSHGGVFTFIGNVGSYSMLCQTTEGLGNKNWIAEWMYQFSGTGKTYYQGIGFDTAMMAVNDVIAQGAMPVTYTDEVAAGNDDWFKDEKRSRDLADGFYDACCAAGMALIAGESPALKYLIKSEPPVASAPSLSGCVVGIINPLSLITGRKLCAGDRIIGVPSTGLHANGVSLVIKRAMSLPDKFMTKLPNGQTLGEEALIPTCCYVSLVETLLRNEVDIHALLPGTGGGVGKVAFDKRPFFYVIHSWPKVIPPLFEFMRGLGVSLKDCLTTFNWGIGYYIFVPPKEVDRTLRLGREIGHDLMEVGEVQKGKREVLFMPEDIVLPPPGE
jgi:phosphoribosylformylglycinamidine cyclo-ligase